VDINRQSLDALNTAYSKAFADALAVGGVEYAPLATEVPAATKITEFPFLEQFGGMREWIGDRQIKNVASRKLTVTARTFEDTFAVKRVDIEDDQYGTYTPLAAEMGMNAANLWGELVFAALVGNATWLDGVAFFSTAGRNYDGTNAINNYGTSALTSATYATAWKAMAGYLGHSGKPLNVVPDTLVVGPKLVDTAKKIVELPVVATTGLTGESTYVYGVTAPNEWYNSAKLMVSTQLVGTYDDYWFLACTKRAMRPVVLVKRQAPEFVALTSPDDDQVFSRDRYVYGTRARGEAALALPHLIFGNYVA
jgi:phage major head subunit gpT-like protein